MMTSSSTVDRPIGCVSSVAAERVSYSIYGLLMATGLDPKADILPAFINWYSLHLTCAFLLAYFDQND
jgi:hypothetical protein